MYKEYSNEYWMNYALEQARLALQEDEVPIGAVLVKDNKIVAADHNRTRQTNNNLAHAEKQVIEKVINSGEKYLYDYTLFVTVEPCLMCAGAIIWARVGKVVFGCFDPKAGAVGSIYNALLDKNFNHHPKVVSGILSQECSDLIVGFFKSKR
ncbi:MAG: tRNA adenosine(34) deaminase TadA [Candidatus Cloacimonetes bacterium]|nr:tRNA adenosine(34) deaminase TadA [Candidatus Cloacimonadota bacterium]